MRLALATAACLFLRASSVAGAADDGDLLLENLHRQIRNRTVEIVDLSHPLKPGVPVFPGGVPFEHVATKTHEANGYASNRFSMGEHTGTHLDAPFHFHREGRRIDQIPLEDVFAPLCVLDIREECGQNPNYQLTIDEILAWERTHGPIPPQAVVVLWTGQDQYWDRPEAYVNMGADRLPHFAGFSDQAAQFLTDERDISGAGTDALSVDPGGNKRLTVHRIFHGAQKFHLENLTGLERVPARGAFLMAFPIPIANGSGAPVRAVALLARKNPS